MSERNEWPLNAICKAQDANGEWWYYRDVPEVGEYGWRGNYISSGHHYETDVRGCWKETLVMKYESNENKYSTSVGDVYDVLKAFDVTNPALQHLIKKALKVGKRGHKDAETDLQDIIDSAVRAKQLEGNEE